MTVVERTVSGDEEMPDVAKVERTAATPSRRRPGNGRSTNGAASNGAVVNGAVAAIGLTPTSAQTTAIAPTEGDQAAQDNAVPDNKVQPIAVETAPSDAVRSARRAWELAEQLTEVRRLLAESAERETIRELEITALHKDLELKTAYTSMLDSTIEERRTQILWLESQLETRGQELAQSRTELASSRTELAQAHARVDEIHSNLVHLHAHVTVLERRIDAESNATAAALLRQSQLEAELAEERSRLSYRVTARLIGRVGRNRLLMGMARRAATRADKTPPR